MTDDEPTTALSPLDGLPDWLEERTRLVGDTASGTVDGSFVLYWMHHAVRGHENPALDVARFAADRLGVPLIVYQGLGGRHPFNNDRHHTFILEGARDAAAELEAMGIRHVFWLPEDPGQPSPLHDLARRSALVVTEDYPAPPFPAWTGRLAERCARPAVVVDTSCVVPMRLVPGRQERAFQFRDKTRKLFRARAGRDLPVIACPPLDAASIDVGFDPTDLAGLDIAEACSRCEIDHSVAPVAHTRGGSVAGYARWERFKSIGMKTYHKRRNRAEIERDECPVSRMSAYLHHGQVSPFRLMRESHAMLDGAAREGAEKFIDELWVWRELAHHLAFHRHADLHSTRVLPEWATRTIADHAGDPREVLDAETLARGRTGDVLWDAAQRSLLAHGELHNNVRMTWGKAMLGWHRDARSTLRSLIELNHRYALDGCDPNSYGGLLWCLGVFDRPFNEDKPIYGALRTRPTDEHAVRMNLNVYRRQVARPSWDSSLRVGVIGGGVAGMAAARVLADHNLEVVVFDKGRGPGGRASTRRHGEHRFDHGAQFFVVSDARFARAVDAWVQAGFVRAWSPRLGTIRRRGEIDRDAHTTEWFVGAPGMNTVVRHLAETLGPRAEVRFNKRVVGLLRHQSGWSVRCEGDSETETFDALVVATPAPQAATLLENTPGLASIARGIPIAPCWAGMFAFDESLPIGHDAVRIEITGGALAWAARDSSKPGRDPGERWVLHATADWTRDHLDLGREQIARPLLDAFRDATSAEIPDPVHADAHRWLYALGSAGDERRMLFERDSLLAVAGDGCADGRIEGAYLSGIAAAGRILGEVSQRATDTLTQPERLLFQ